MNTKHSSSSLILLGAILLVCVGNAFAQKSIPRTEAALKNEPVKQLDSFWDVAWGGDIRVREEYYDNIPINSTADSPKNLAGSGENIYTRVRERLFGRVDAGKDYSLVGRLANEWRKYQHPSANESMNPMDEVFVDNLYLEGRGLLGGAVDARLGRQDLFYGTGKLLADGTPLDGSRSYYFDAAKVSVKTAPHTVIDLLGILNSPRNQLVINSKDRNLTGYYPAGADDYQESGAGLYGRSVALGGISNEFYYLWKHEDDYTKGTNVLGSVDVQCIGTRWMPRFSDSLNANLELAYQFGRRAERIISAGMVDAVVKWQAPVLAANKPVLGLGWYYLTGDNQNFGRDQGWDPLFARWPQYSELYVFAWNAEGAGNWQNLSMPYLTAGLSVNEWLKPSALIGWMAAPVANGPGGGADRGLMMQVRDDFTIGKGLLREKDKLGGYLLAEIFNPGNYYTVTDTAMFVRAELMYSF